MSADISLLLKSPWMVLGLTVLLIALKAPVLYFVGRISGGLDKASALRLGVVLAAGGEFAFVVFKMARDQGLFQNDLHNLLVLSITLSMALTPLLVLGSRACWRRSRRRRSRRRKWNASTTTTPRAW